MALCTDTLELFASPAPSSGAAPDGVHRPDSDGSPPTNAHPEKPDRSVGSSPEADSTDRCSTRIEQVRVDSVEPNPHDPREYLRDTKHHALVESLRTEGQDEIISVYDQGDRYRIRSGTLLWHAAKEAGLATLRAEVHPPASRLEDLRRIARGDAHLRPRGAYESARLAGAMREALQEEWGRAPSRREIAPHLAIAYGTVSERLLVYDHITREVIARSGISRAELVALSHTALHLAAARASVLERAAWLYKAVHRRFPKWWQSSEEASNSPRQMVLLQRRDGSMRLDIPDPSTMDHDTAQAALQVLTPLVAALQDRISRPEQDRVGTSQDSAPQAR